MAGSIGSFFFFYAIEDRMPMIPTLFGTYAFAMTIPSYYALCLYFTMFVITSEMLFHYTNKLYLKRKERRLKDHEQKEMIKKQEANRAFAKKGTMRHTGFAFSSD